MRVYKDFLPLKAIVLRLFCSVVVVVGGGVVVVIDVVFVVVIVPNVDVVI